MHHANSFQVDESFTDLQAEQQQGRVCQRALVLYEIVPQLQRCHKSTGEVNGTNHSLKKIIHRLTEIKAVTDLSVLVELHNDPHWVLLYDPDQADDVLVVELLHDNWEQSQSATALHHTYILVTLFWS